MKKVITILSLLLIIITFCSCNDVKEYSKKEYNIAESVVRIVDDYFAAYYPAELAQDMVSSKYDELVDIPTEERSSEYVNLLIQIPQLERFLDGNHDDGAKGMRDIIKREAGIE